MPFLANRPYFVKIFWLYRGGGVRMWNFFSREMWGRVLTTHVQSFVKIVWLENFWPPVLYWILGYFLAFFVRFCLSEYLSFKISPNMGFFRHILVLFDISCSSEVINIEIWYFCQSWVINNFLLYWMLVKIHAIIGHVMYVAWELKVISIKNVLFAQVG